MIARFLMAALLLAGYAAVAAGNVSRPNVLVIMADQWRAQAFGYAGDPNVKTPHLDALERQSVNFTHAISSLPVCCPMRASFLTGQRALTHGVFMNDLPLATNAVTFAKVLKAQGYDTGFVGKWHVNGDGRASFIPRERRQGFDYWKALECTHNYNHSYYYGDTPERLQWDGYDAIAQTSDVEQYLQTRATNSRPFVFVLSWGPPHDPYGTAPEKYRALYDAATVQLRGNVPTNGPTGGWRRDLAGYYAHCSALDDCIGTILRTLHETGLETNTIVIFTADHGDMLGSHGLAKKQKPWDESIRVPLLVRCPPRLHIKPRRVDAVFATEDFMSTILGLCGVAIPPSEEGLDYSGYLRGGRDPSGGAALISCVAPFAEYQRLTGGREFRGVRTMRYTFVRQLSGPWLLFDNEKDPLQMTNLVNLHDTANLQKKLDGLLSKKLRAARDDFQPAEFYIKKWGWKTDATGTVPYAN
jgi:arylsulfatase A-like enzyme